MRHRSAQGMLRIVGVCRVASGGLMLLAIARNAVPGLADLPPQATTAARVLAVRDLLQGTSLLAAPAGRTAGVAELGSAIDAMHAASMVALATVSPRYRKAAALSAVTAVAWIIVTRWRR